MILFFFEGKVYLFVAVEPTKKQTSETNNPENFNFSQSADAGGAKGKQNPY